LSGEWDAAAARLQRPLGLFRDIKARWQIGRTLFELGDSAIARRDSAAARSCYAEALSMFEALRAAPDAIRARAALAPLS
jgi:hypothetical protein